MIIYQRGSRFVLRSVLTVTTIVGLATTAHATKFWKNSVTAGTWNTSNNWSAVSAAGADNGGVPVASEAVNIVNTDGTARTVTLNVNTPTIYTFAIDLTGAGTAADTLSLTTNNTLVSNGGINVGGYNGSAATAGRGAITQSNGSISTTGGVDWVVGNGAGSNGTYTLSGAGAVVATQSEYIGLYGTGVFNQSGGTNMINSGSIGGFDVGVFAGANGTYNLSLTGQLTSNKNEYIGDFGTGVFTQSGGINTLGGTNSIYLGNSNGGNGTYTASGSAALIVGGNVVVGNAATGAGTFNVQGNANVNISGTLNIGPSDHVNLSSGTLRFNSYARNATGVFSFSGGRVQLAGARNMNFDSAIGDLFGGSNPTIANGHNLTVEGTAIVDGGTVTVSNANFVSQGQLSVGYETDNGTLNITNGSTVTNAGVNVGDTVFGSSAYNHSVVNVDGSVWNTGSITVGKGGQGTVNVTNGGYVVSSSVNIGFDINGPHTDLDTILVSGPGSTWISNGSFYVGGQQDSRLRIENGGNVYVSDTLDVRLYSEVDMNGGTLRFNTLYLEGLTEGYDYAGKLIYNGGTIQFAGSRNVGTDADIQRLYGTVPVISFGKGLTIENTMTLSTALRIDGGSLKTFSLSVASGGSLNFAGGTFELTGGTVTGLNSLGVPTGGEFKALGTYSFRVTGAADSTITATGALTVGNSTAVNGFGTQGTLSVGANTVTLLDANDVVFDSLSLATLGNGASTGVLSAANGLTLDFGGNITGYGTVSTPNNIAKPTIINGHVIGTSASQKITMSGYVKGAGTFDNVTFTGTFSPGFSPTTVIAGSMSFGSTNTLVMELGGTTPGSTYDQIQASGALGLDGILQISLINGFNPAAGQSFDILNWGSISGAFSSINLPTLAGLTWNTSQLYTTGVISAAGVGLPGDFSNDGYVDARDYVVWRKRNGTQAEYNTWRANFGASLGGAGTSVSVPEPSTLMSLFLAATSLVAFRRDRAAAN